MSCPLCSENHALLNCLHYVSASQTLKDFLGDVYQKFHLSNAVLTMRKIYDDCYAKTGDKDTNWVVLGGSTFGITHRVYLSVKPEAILRVWGVLQHALPQIQGFKMAKHCQPSEAVNRPDTIVIYVAGTIARDAVVNRIREMLRDSDWHRPAHRGPMTLPARLNAQDFKFEVPSGTGRIADLQGVAVAENPGPGQSFGEKLSETVAEAWKAEPYRQDRLLFVGYALGVLARHNFNLRKPWTFA